MKGFDASRIRNTQLLYPEYSYTINGVLFEVHNTLGPGHPEKYYQKATALALTKAGLIFKEQFYVPMKFNNRVIGKYFLDFLVEDKIILKHNNI